MGRPRKSVPRQSPELADREARTLTIRFDDAGNPLPLTPENRERLGDAATKLLGSDRLSTPSAPPVITPEFAGRVVDSVTRAQAWLAGRVAGVPTHDMHRAIKFSAEQKVEVAGPLQAVLEADLGLWLAQHQDLWGLLVVIGSIEMEKIERAIALQRAEDARRAKSTGRTQ